MMPRVRFITLGCRVNQYETQAMREQLEREGMMSLSRVQAKGHGPEHEVEWVIINTCTVTGEADRENLYWIRRARREHPKARIAVTGCFAEKDRPKILALGGIDLVLGNREKPKLAEHLRALALGEDESGRGCKDGAREFPDLRVSGSFERSRAYIKIQDGCDHRCSYCKVVLVRGRSRSRPIDEIVEETERLAASGLREIVLTGVQLGAYGRDFARPSSLPEVIRACARIPGIARIRLSSIEPTDITTPLIETLSTLEQCCSHLHIPLQSGDNGVLRRMNRRYRRDFFKQKVIELQQAMPDFLFSTDVIAGFPGETEREFESTVALLEELRPLKCHVFPYSRREGTRAASFLPLPAKVVRERVKRLLAMSLDLSRQAQGRFSGRIFPVLIEGKQDREGHCQGLTSNHMKVFIRTETLEPGTLVRVRLVEPEEEAWRAELVGLTLGRRP
ncbi:MAG: tRNA (N(6)-L-threonylcarbamoyladenosine(37)-C(2))-methylthiotransferase MtaB [Candidatus Omnitrophota bacterium]